MAPATEIEVEGFLTKGGAIYESEIAEELNEALRDKDEPQLISISAGTHTRRNLPLMGFQALADAYRLKERDDGPLVVAAAGNDGNDVPFYPAAFDWVVSVGALDADGKKSDFSNYGKWVDVYAHGRDLVNAFPTGTYTCHEPASAGRRPKLHRPRPVERYVVLDADRDRRHRGVHERARGGRPGGTGRAARRSGDEGGPDGGKHLGGRPAVRIATGSPTRWSACARRS